MEIANRAVFELSEKVRSAGREPGKQNHDSRGPPVMPAVPFVFCVLDAASQCRHRVMIVVHPGPVVERHTRRF